MPTPCPICDDSGLRIIERPDGTRAAQECSCRAEKRATKKLAGARIPERYQHCTLEDYEPNYQGQNKSLATALVQARNFVRGYPLETGGSGLLLTGSIGVGKTHLAVGVLQALISERGAKGLFWDYRDLLKAVQHSYNPAVATTEHDVLRPVFEAEVLVLDELGANRPTEWVWDTVAHILNTRYNDRRTTIITTNYTNLPPGGESQSSDSQKARNATREETLGDRIGERMRSRLQEMCVVMDMRGEDFRQGALNATRRAGLGARYA